MKKDDKDRSSAVGLFRYKVIAPLLEAARGTLFALALKLSTLVYDIPGSDRTRVAATTMLEWKRKYDEGGLEALEPKRRSDRNRARRMDPDAAEALIGIKQDNPHLSVRLVIEEAYRLGLVDRSTPLPPSTVHRVLRREGLTAKSADSEIPDLRRFAYEYAGEMWQSDVLHGPKVRDGRGRMRKTYLIALLDDATRVIPFAEFAFGESTRDFLPVLREAIERRGVPKRLFADNGATYRSNQLVTICAKMRIAMIHARPYMPTSKGKIERWIRRVRQQFIPTLCDADFSSLEALNRRFRSWVENEYHRTGHHGLGGMTPLDRWALGAGQVRYIDARIDLSDIFMFETTRKVKKDRTVQLHSRVYEVEAHLVGLIVTLRYDPSAPPSRPIQVRYKDEPPTLARLVDVHANAKVKRGGPVQPLSFRKGASDAGGEGG